MDPLEKAIEIVNDMTDDGNSIDGQALDERISEECNGDDLVATCVATHVSLECHRRGIKVHRRTEEPTEFIKLLMSEGWEPSAEPGSLWRVTGSRMSVFVEDSGSSIHIDQVEWAQDIDPRNADNRSIGESLEIELRGPGRESLARLIANALAPKK